MEGMIINYPGNLTSYNIGIYVRESRDDGDENYETIETQRDLLINYVKNNKIGEILSIYIDNNVSGSGFERNGIEQLKKDVLENKINLLVLKDLSRLGRNNARTLLFLDFLEEYGVRVITFDGRYDSIKDNDTVGIDTWYNERYIRDISKKIRANLRFKIEKGEYIGRAPFGYKKSSDEKNKLVIKSDEANIVQKIYELYQDGYGYSYIARLLNKEGYESPKKLKWSSATIRRIICSSVYAGDTVQGVSEKISFKSKKTRKLDQSQWVVTHNTHEPIIQRELYEKVQETRKNKNTNSASHKGDIHTFRGLVYCGRCKSLMFARKRKERPMGYICSNYSKFGKSSCSSHHIREKDLSEIIIKDLLKLINKDNTTKKLLEDEAFNENNNILIENIKTQIKSKKRQQEIMYKDKLDEKISEDLFTRINQQIENKLLFLEKELENAKNKEILIKDTNSIIDYVKNKIKKNSLENRIVKLIVNRIIIFDKGDKFEDKLWDLVVTEKEKETISKYGAILIEYSFNN
ncbi:UNVERIFIED_CONTAM: DNA invertase Pin-like site-specific DNA recombinase [Acetivibrio alkalicellulosi]